MAVISFGSSITLAQFAEAIIAVGQDVTLVGQGQPGIGKSSVCHLLRERLPESEVVYIDCALLDVGDLTMPYVTDEGGVKVLKFAANSRFGFHLDKPVCVGLDELGKAPKVVINALLTLLLEHRIGDFHLPVGSRVFATTNLASDGVGDYLQGHARNRVCMVHISNPHFGFAADGSLVPGGWAEWAMDNDVDPLVISYVKQNPQLFASYLDPVEQDNPYIWNPVRAGSAACVTPRSLEKASHIIKRREVLRDAPTLALLAGTIGEAGARDMQAFFTLVDKLPTWPQIVTQPGDAPVPDDAAARCHIVCTALQRIDDKTTAPFIEYLKRLDKEWQAMFIGSALKSKAKVGVVSKNRAFVDLARANQWMV